jgi:hypothetical protein
LQSGENGRPRSKGDDGTAIIIISLLYFTKLAQGEQAGKEKGWMTIEEVEAELGIENV